MGAWDKNSASHVASMQEGDFYASEQSVILPEATEVTVILQGTDGTSTVLKKDLKLLKSEILDSAVMSSSALRAFLAEQIRDAKEKDVLFSIHLKATMMKVSDPIMFGHAFSVFFEKLFEGHKETLSALGVDPRLGMSDLLRKIDSLASEEQEKLLATIEKCYTEGPKLAMVNSDKGITNLHVSSDVIIDASMPAAIRSSGKMWGPDGKLKDMKAVIPDRLLRRHLRGDDRNSVRKTERSILRRWEMSQMWVSWLRRQKNTASHDKTFEIEKPGTVQVIDRDGKVLMVQDVSTGDIFRMCQVKDEPIRDWVKLAVKRARATGSPAVFWLDPARAHDSRVAEKVREYLPPP